MQSVLVSPTPRVSIVMGKVLGGTTLAMLEAAIFLVFGWFVDIPFTLLSLACTLGFLFLTGLGLTGLGFVIAWRMDSTAGFHAVMNLFLLPMWLLSGAFFPPSGAHEVLRWVIAVNPLTYGMAGLRHVLYMNDPARIGDVSGLPVSIAVTVGFGLAMLGLCILVVRSREKEAGR